MVTVDGNTVTVSDDFTRLAEQYGNASGPNTPSQSDAGSTQYPACPQQNSSFLASTTLPPTPNDSACDCVVNSLSCQFTPQTDNTSIIVGTLLDTVGLFYDVNWPYYNPILCVPRPAACLVKMAAIATTFQAAVLPELMAEWHSVTPDPSCRSS